MDTWTCCRRLYPAQVIYCVACHKERPTEATLHVARERVARIRQRQEKRTT